MLDLEMADYERTISSLHAQVAERDSKVTQTNKELEKLEQRISLMQTQMGKKFVSFTFYDDVKLLWGILGGKGGERALT